MLKWIYDDETLLKTRVFSDITTDEDHIRKPYFLYVKKHRDIRNKKKLKNTEATIWYIFFKLGRV